MIIQHINWLWSVLNQFSWCWLNSFIYDLCSLHVHSCQLCVVWFLCVDCLQTLFIHTLRWITFAVFDILDIFICWFCFIHVCIYTYIHAPFLFKHYLLFVGVCCAFFTDHFGPNCRCLRWLLVVSIFIRLYQVLHVWTSICGSWLPLNPCF